MHEEHSYRPGWGPHSPWQDILEHAIEGANILEVRLRRGQDVVAAHAHNLVQDPRVRAAVNDDVVQVVLGCHLVHQGSEGTEITNLVVFTCACGGDELA